MKADVVVLAEGSKPTCGMASMSGFHRGLRPGHVLKGATRELGRAEWSPCATIGKGQPTGGEPEKARQCRGELAPGIEERIKTSDTRYRGGNIVETDVRQS